MASRGHRTSRSVRAPLNTSLDLTLVSEHEGFFTVLEMGHENQHVQGDGGRVSPAVHVYLSSHSVSSLLPWAKMIRQLRDVCIRNGHSICQLLCVGSCVEGGQRAIEGVRVGPVDVKVN